VLFGRIVDEDVEAPEAIDGPLDGFVAELRRADIAPQQQAVASFLLDELFRLLGVLVLLEIDDGDFRALAREEDARRPADTAIAAADQRDLTLEAIGARIARLVIRLRPHLALDAGLMRLLLGWQRRFGAAFLHVWRSLR
jgi:hypothetical protein